tara:strand:- start:5131 stop:5295 length:165 start_codon:yes stop_codon:yes gene_type:complete
MKWIRIIVLVAALVFFLDWAKDTKFVKELFPDLHWDYKWNEVNGEIQIDYDAKP